MSKLHKAQTTQGHSKHFFEFIRCVGEAKSKQEEDKIVVKDLIALKAHVNDKKIDSKAQKENAIRVLYAEMLGHSAEFAHIHIVNLASATDLLHKRVGYLATWLCVNPEHEFMYLMVSRIQRDMKSPSFLEIAAALTAASKLIKPELMSALAPEVAGLLAHTNALVRKKAVICLHSFFRRSDGLVADVKSFRSAVCDRDPSVMAAALALFVDVIMQDPVSHRDLLPSFLHILKQITEHHLSREYDYHRVPAPWVQIKLLRLIAVLAGEDRQLAERCSELLHEVIKRADTGLNIGHAIIFEAISAVTSMFPIPELIEVAADATAKFLACSNSNMKYLGITALSRIVTIDPKYAQEHQHVVINCLEDPDETIRRKTLTLLFAMCNENNVVPIMTRLVKFLGQATDAFVRQDLVKNMCNLAERFAPSNEWYVQTMNRLLELSAEHVSQTTIQGMLKIIAEGDGESEAEDALFRTACVESYVAIVEDSQKKLSSQLIQVAAWVIGEYGFLTKSVSRTMLLDILCDLLERARDADTKGWIITATMKLIAFNGSLPGNVEDVVFRLKDSRSVSLQQRCYEFAELSKMQPVLKKVQPLDGCCEDVDVDTTLSFLDGLVKDALANGSRPYQKKEVKDSAVGALRTAEYETTRGDVVNLANLDAAMFEKEATDKLITKVDRWGKANLAEEAAVEPTLATIHDDGSEAQGGTTNDGGATAGGASHADPMAELVTRKKTKNEKFVEDLFGGGGGGRTAGAGRKKKPGASRAEEAERRAAEALAATKNMTAEERRANVATAAPTAAPATAAPAAPAAAPRPAASAAAAPAPSVAGPSPPVNGNGGGHSAARVELNLQKQQGPDCVRLRIGILADGPISRVMVVLTPPPKCTLELRAAIPGAEVRDAAVAILALPAGQPQFIEGMLKAADFPGGPNISVAVTYTSENGAPGTANGLLALAIPDFMRPAADATTEIFGQHWKAHSGECRVQLKFPVALTPDVLAKFLGQAGNIRMIQVIGRECIAAARVVPCGHWVLTHLTVDGSNANTTIRCNSKEFAEIVGRTLVGALAAAAAAGKPAA